MENTVPLLRSGFIKESEILMVPPTLGPGSAGLESEVSVGVAGGTRTRDGTQDQGVVSLKPGMLVASSGEHPFPSPDLGRSGFGDRRRGSCISGNRQQREPKDQRRCQLLALS